jgi:hypothetical protein
VSVHRHRDTAVKTGHTYAFARKVNSVPITAVEFAHAGAEYPIVFAGTEDAVFPAVVLGARAENLFVGEDGKWLGKYIPAFVRRYPFVFSVAQDRKNFTLHLDETFEGVNRSGDGERLFEPNGAHTPYLEQTLRFLQEYQKRFQRTRAFCRRLQDLKLLQPMQAHFTLSSGERRSLSGFMTVDREKLKSVPATELTLMLRSDELECTFLHLASLRHFRGMLERFAPKQATIGTDGDGELDGEGPGIGQGPSPEKRSSRGNGGLA